VALEEEFVDQADGTCIEQPWDQMELCTLHIHLHHHIVLLRYRLLQPLGKIKRWDTPDLTRYVVPSCRADAAHAMAIGLGLILLSRVTIDLEIERLILDPGCIWKQGDTLLGGILGVERGVGLNGVHLEGVVLLRVVLAEPAADTGAIAAGADINIQVAALEADIGERREVLDVVDVSLERDPWLERLLLDEWLGVCEEVALVIPN